jgi:hypothetical protein
VSTGAYGANAGYDDGSENGEGYAAAAGCGGSTAAAGLYEDPQDRPWTPVPRPAAASDRGLIPLQRRHGA